MPVSYGDLLYEFKRIVGMPSVSVQSKRICCCCFIIYSLSYVWGFVLNHDFAI